MMLYFFLKYVHVMGAAVLLGTGAVARGLDPDSNEESCGRLCRPGSAASEPLLSSISSLVRLRLSRVRSGVGHLLADDHQTLGLVNAPTAGAARAGERFEHALLYAEFSLFGTCLVCADAA